MRNHLGRQHRVVGETVVLRRGGVEGLKIVRHHGHGVVARLGHDHLGAGVVGLLLGGAAELVPVLADRLAHVGLEEEARPVQVAQPVVGLQEDAAPVGDDGAVDDGDDLDLHAVVVDLGHVAVGDGRDAKHESNLVKLVQQLQRQQRVHEAVAAEEPHARAALAPDVHGLDQGELDLALGAIGAGVLEVEGRHVVEAEGRQSGGPVRRVLEHHHAVRVHHVGQRDALELAGARGLGARRLHVGVRRLADGHAEAGPRRSQHVTGPVAIRPVQLLPAVVEVRVVERVGIPARHHVRPPAVELALKGLEQLRLAVVLHHVQELVLGVHRLLLLLAVGSVHVAGDALVCAQALDGRSVRVSVYEHLGPLSP